MISIEIHYRPSQRKKASPGSLFVRVIACRKTASLTLPYRLLPSEWDPEGRCILLDDAPRERRGYLGEVVSLLEKDLRLLEELKEDLCFVDQMTARSLIEAFRSRRFKSGFKRMVDSLSEELLREGRERTARAYQSSLSSLLTFMGKTDLSPAGITYGSLKGLEVWLRERGRSLNTISFYMRNLRAMYNKAVKRGWIVEGAKDLFSDVYTGVAVSKKRALTEIQMKQFCNLLDDPSDLVPDETDALSLFVFSFHGRGIPFVDLAYLKKENVKDKYLIYHRRKTGTKLEVEINERMKGIIARFAGRVEGSPFLFPLISPDSSSYYKSYTDALRLQNDRLRRVAKKCDLSVPLTTHVARHSWATLAKKKGIPLWLISECLGHRDLQTTMIYLDSFDREVLYKAARKVSGAIL